MSKQDVEIDKKDVEIEKLTEMENLFDKLSLENKSILLMVANGMILTQNQMKEVK